MDDIELREVYVSGVHKEKILEELRVLAITHENLFPEISNSASFISKSFE